MKNSILISVFIIMLSSCANRGTPQGGEKDKTPPKITKSFPENYTTNFNGKEIKIYFDEYIKLKNLQRQLIVSPPMNPPAEVTPLGSASKYITIKIHDTLAPNTTYAFNFGNSIVDNNEENPFTYFRYVFSTGNTIDSLTVKGNVEDALERKPDDFISVMLYEMDSTFTDSIIYKQQPKYITNTLDSTTAFSVENVKAGRYLLVALKEKTQDYKFQQKTDKIAFRNHPITVPSDSLYTLKLFFEDIDFEPSTPRQRDGQHIIFGYEGSHKNTDLTLLKKPTKNFKYRITKDTEKDTLHFWYKPKLEDDSLQVKVTHNDFNEDFTIKVKDKKQDTLRITAQPKSTITLTEDFNVLGNIPFTKIDKKRISVIDKDSLKVDFKTKLDSLYNSYAFQFDKTESNTYKIQLLPNALTDFFGNTNDTLNYTLRTKSKDDYGDIRITLQNATYPVIVQLTDDKGNVKYERYGNKPQPFDFQNVEPKTYFLRVVFDANKNQRYDTGNYLKKQQPERVSHFPEKIEVRSSWSMVYDFILE